MGVLTSLCYSFPEYLNDYPSPKCSWLIYKWPCCRQRETSFRVTEPVLQLHAVGWAEPPRLQPNNSGRHTLSILIILFQLRWGRRKNQLPAGFKVWEQKIQPNELAALPLCSLLVPFQVGYLSLGLKSESGNLHGHLPHFPPWIAPGNFYLSFFKFFLFFAYGSMLVPGAAPWVYHQKRLHRCYKLVLGLSTWAEGSEISGYSAGSVITGELLSSPL